jgi:putative phosphoribosyl transferase
MTTGQENIEAVHDPEPEASARFPNRHEAGNQLAAVLTAYRDSDALVLGVPRGGVIVAAAVARQLGAELDAVISRKIAVPAEPELAMGAATADGGVYVNERTVTVHDVSEEQLAAAIAHETAAAKAPRNSFAAIGRRASRTGRSSSSTTGWPPERRCGRRSVRCGQNIQRAS